MRWLIPLGSGDFGEFGEMTLASFHELDQCLNRGIDLGQCIELGQVLADTLGMSMTSALPGLVS